jgi:hypothetical protein
MDGSPQVKGNSRQVLVKVPEMNGNTVKINVTKHAKSVKTTMYAEMAR